jgi:N-formylglutamate amidohydrolase
MQAERTLTQSGFRVVRNTPYAGGFTTRHYGLPSEGRHALQIEVNRRLYMNEMTHEKRPGFAQLQAELSKVVAALASLTPSELRP